MKNKMLIFLMILFTSIGFVQANTPSRLETVKSYAKPISKIVLGAGVVGFEFARFACKYDYLQEEMNVRNPFPNYFKAINSCLDEPAPKNLFNGLSLISHYAAAILLINQGISELKELKKEHEEIETTQRDESVSNKFQDAVATLWNKIKQN